MTLRGFVKDGVVVPYDPSGLVEGAEVDIRPREAPAPSKARSTKKKSAAVSRPKQPTKKKAKPVTRASKHKKRNGLESLRELLQEFTGIAKDLPPDFARNHDHYIHGGPKRK
jgi:hypothetical protein